MLGMLWQRDISLRRQIFLQSRQMKKQTWSNAVFHLMVWIISQQFPVVSTPLIVNWISGCWLSAASGCSSLKAASYSGFRTGSPEGSSRRPMADFFSMCRSLWTHALFPKTSFYFTSQQMESVLLHEPEPLF